MSMDTKGFKKGDRVYHVAGGCGVLIGHFENDCLTDPPTVLASVELSNTIFHDVRKINVDDLRKDRRRPR